MLNKNNPYYQQVALLIAVLPLVEEENCFALKAKILVKELVKSTNGLHIV